MATSNQYGSVAPAAIDPFPIESVLAKIVGEQNPQEAANMLDTYQIERQTSQGNYDYALQGQHDFARDQLKQQLYEANLKGLAEAKDPSVLQLMAGNPTYSGVLGTNAANIGDVLARARAAQDATTFQHGAAGLQSATTAGFQPNTDQAARATMGLAGPQGTPEAEKVAGINAAARLAAAALHAKAGGNDAMTMTYQNTPPPGKEGPSGVTFGAKSPFQTVEQQTAELIRRGVKEPPPGYTGPTPANPQGLGGGGGAPAAGTPQKKGMVPGLKMAPRDEGSGGSAQPVSNANADIQKRADALRVAIQNNQIDPAIAARIKSGMVNGQPRLGTVNGKIVALDGQGKPI